MARYYYNQIITLKREIIVDDEIKNFIFENINYRRKVYNDFVEEYWSTFLNPLIITKRLYGYCANLKDFYFKK